MAGVGYIGPGTGQPFEVPVQFIGGVIVGLGVGGVVLLILFLRSRRDRSSA